MSEENLYNQLSEQENLGKKAVGEIDVDGFKRALEEQYNILFKLYGIYLRRLREGKIERMEGREKISMLAELLYSWEDRSKELVSEMKKIKDEFNKLIKGEK